MGTSPNGLGTPLLDAMGNKHVVLLGSELPIREAKCACMLCVQVLQALLHAQSGTTLAMFEAFQPPWLEVHSIDERVTMTTTPLLPVATPSHGWDLSCYNHVQY